MSSTANVLPPMQKARSAASLALTHASVGSSRNRSSGANAPAPAR